MNFGLHNTLAATKAYFIADQRQMQAIPGVTEIHGIYTTNTI